MTNEEKKIKSLWYHFCRERSCDGHDDCDECTKSQIHPQLKEIAEWKDEQFKQQLRQQEAKLLSVVEKIVSLSAQTKSGYNFAMSIFKNEMINKDL